ncbi:gamma-interferon-inducible lysosomal thiol reductase-like [Panulirus ornatus]|uniref:gamma-interferon-inducible lysosomal thiol reductase-like n=1 Tax=Panulirus ornatus TaxID=150431 RepID=UPI003A867BBC
MASPTSTTTAATLLHLLLTLVAFLPYSAEAAEPVLVTVYYESLCPDSQRFITTQLYPVWIDLKDIMVLDVNAYGKSSDTSVGEGYTFECQHGPDECEGNMMLTCAKGYIPSEEQFMAFTNCVMTNFVGAAAGKQCAHEAGVDFANIENCYNTVEGQQLQHQVGLKQATLDPQLIYVPWILIDDVFSEEQLSAAQEDLRGVVCEAYQGQKPDLCNNKDFVYQYRHRFDSGI